MENSSMMPIANVGILVFGSILAIGLGIGLVDWLKVCAAGVSCVVW